ncbi:MAG TPA: hypothetical protein PKC55_10290 [Dysgonomonas sp.]|uniref:hypothetical protein n=1 Tax=unclassified Dysgonomonas TaxID=2630389 RepID=UPI0025C57E0D|nr:MULTISPECIES: hypothetical protein [unclassified Dysgonomonas]HML65208.1 hypothetical protein [Dysgonomonas sp.]
MGKSINTNQIFYMVPDLDPPERKRLLDRLEINSKDIGTSNILHNRENKRWCISGKRIINESDIPEGYKKNLEIPTYKMSEVEDDRFRLSTGHYSAYFFTTENSMSKAAKKIQELGLNYKPDYKDFETKGHPLFLAFNNTVYPCTTDQHTQNTMDAIGLDWDNFHNPPYPIDELVAGQRKNLEILEERCLSFIPYSCRTLPVCTMAAECNPFNIKDIPEYLLTRKFVGDIIETNPLNLKFIPADRLDKNLCIQAIDKNSAAFINLHKELKTSELCLMAVKQDESLKKYVPKSIVNDPKLNMYRFGMLVEEQISLNFTQVKNLYEGKRVEINYTTPTNQIPRKVEIEYNIKRESLNYFDSARDTKRPENKPEDTILNKRKGLKM